MAKSTLSKVQIPRCRKGQSPTTPSEVDAVQSPTLQKKKKKKSKFCGNLTRSGVRVRGLGLVWTSALTRSDRDQRQTRSRTRHRNLTRLVSHVLLTSPIFHVSSVWIPTLTASSRKELAGNWLENLRDSQRTPRYCRAAERNFPPYSLHLSQNYCHPAHAHKSGVIFHIFPRAFKQSKN